MGLQPELPEGEFDAMARLGGEVPDAVLAGRVEVGPVGAGDDALRFVDLVLTATWGPTQRLVTRFRFQNGSLNSLPDRVALCCGVIGRAFPVYLCDAT